MEKEHWENKLLVNLLKNSFAILQEKTNTELQENIIADTVQINDPRKREFHVTIEDIYRAQEAMKNWVQPKIRLHLTEEQINAAYKKVMEKLKKDPKWQAWEAESKKQIDMLVHQQK